MSAEFEARLKALPPGRRLVAIAGAPGSGKSTLAEALSEKLPNAAVVPMDGFHYDDAVLEARGHRARKGAPHTFDVDGLRHLLSRLKDGKAEVAIPRFDRDLEISRAGAAIVGPEHEVLLVEGNYLLLDQPPWDSLHPLFDLTAYIDVPEAELRRRLEARWEGYSMNAAEIEAKLEENDLPNGRVIAQHSIPPDFVIPFK